MGRRRRVALLDWVFGRRVGGDRWRRGERGERGIGLLVELGGWW